MSWTLLQILLFALGLDLSLLLPFPFPSATWAFIFSAFVLGQCLQRRRGRRILGDLLEATDKFLKEGAPLSRSQDPIVDRLTCTIQALGDRIENLREDLTASQQELELLLSSIGDCVLLVGKTKRILLVSRASGELLGWERKELLGQNLFRVVRASEMRKKMAQVEETGEQQELEFQVSDRCLKGQITPITGGQYLIMLADCTDKERLEQVRRDFASNVSHELRTPLTSIQGFVDTLLDGAWQDPEACPHFLRVIKRETARLYRLVEDLLDLSRLETRRLERPIVPVDLGKVARRVLELMSQKAEDKGLELRCTIDDEFPLVMGDKDLLHQVLLNLTDNAISYTEAGFVELVATLSGEKAKIEVRDSGSGISPEEQERIFERFYRVDKARSRHAGGTGLGLAIARHAVERMGGVIGLESKLAEGTVFWIELPVTQS
jgi:two-component system phosphate regulon sensor histidine kinase PhoR